MSPICRERRAVLLRGLTRRPSKCCLLIGPEYRCYRRSYAGGNGVRRCSTLPKYSARKGHWQPYGLPRISIDA